MGQIKVCFTIQHGSEQTRFANKFEMEQQVFSVHLMERFINLEIRLKHAAAEHWLIQKLGQDTLHNLKIHHTSEIESSISMENKKKEPNSLM